MRYRDPELPRGPCATYIVWCMPRRAALVVWVVSAGLALACSRRPATAPSMLRSDDAPRWPSQAGGPGLPGDPDAGGRAEAQWKGHLAHEDRARQLARDRHALADHQAIVGLLVKARLEDTHEIEPQVERHLARINVWGNVSPLTATYRSMAASLRPDGGAESRLEWNRHLAEIRSYLRQAAESEGEDD